MPILLHNARLGKGWTFSLDAPAAAVPGIGTCYNFLNSNQAKEDLWEAVRVKTDRDALPSRRNGFYAFRSADEAHEAAKIWGLGDRLLVEVEPAEDAKVHQADAKLLDCTQDQWEANAEKYWQGEYTSNPLIEVIISGYLYFPAWQTFPSLFKS